MRLLAQLLPAKVVAPPELGQRNDRSGRMVDLGFFQDGAQDVELDVARVERTQGQPEWMGNETGERWFGEARDLRNLCDRYARDAGVIETSLKQPDRLLAHRSRGDKKRQIDVLLSKLVEYPRNQAVEHARAYGDEAHRRDRDRRHRTDETFACQHL